MVVSTENGLDIVDEFEGRVQSSVHCLAADLLGSPPVNSIQVPHVLELWQRNMEESEARENLPVLLNELGALLSVPGDLTWVDAAPAGDAGAVVAHGVEGPEVKELPCLGVIVNGLDVVGRPVDIAGTLLSQTDIELKIHIGDLIPVEIGLRIMIALDVHVGLVLINKRLCPLFPLFLVPALRMIPSVTTDHIAGKHSHVSLLPFD